MDMDYVPLGNTGLNVSVAGLGCGGNSRLGLGAGKSETQCMQVVERALDLGVNFFDTAEAYGTEEIVGKALRGKRREDVVISTKARIGQGEAMHSPEAIVASLNESLTRLGSDYVDVFHLHGVSPSQYAYARDTLAPALVREKEAGKIRHLGITETAVRDPKHAMLNQACDDGIWEVVMFAFHMMNQNARDQLFPATTHAKIGTLLMFVVRNIFSQPGYLSNTIDALIDAGALPPTIDRGAPLDFLMDYGATSLIDGAYRFARYEPGAHVVLFGTGSPEHVVDNVESILRPPLDPEAIARLYREFGHLEDVGLDAPDRMKETK